MAGFKIRNKYGDYKGGLRKDIVEDCRVKHKDVFWVRYLYMMCHEWFIEHNYGSRSDQKWPETLYQHRFNQTGGDEVWIWWRFRKTFNNFIRYDFDLDFHIVGLESAEVIKDGKKFKANKGEPELKIYAKLIFDPNEEFKGWIGKLKEIFYERMYYANILEHRKMLYHDVYEFKEALKTYFNLKTWLPEPEGHKFYLDENMDTPFWNPPPPQ